MPKATRLLHLLFSAFFSSSSASSSLSDVLLRSNTLHNAFIRSASNVPQFGHSVRLLLVSWLAVVAMLAQCPVVIARHRTHSGSSVASSFSSQVLFPGWAVDRTLFTASSPPLLAYQSDSPSVSGYASDRPYSDWTQSAIGRSPTIRVTLAPPPYLLNVLARPSQFTASRLHHASSSSFSSSSSSSSSDLNPNAIQRLLNDQQWPLSPISSTPVPTDGVDLPDEHSVAVAEFNWFERLRAKLTGRSLGAPLNSTSIALLNQTRLKYYSDYDVMMGVRIAVSLSTIISLFALFITYKSYCNARKQRIRSNASNAQESTAVGAGSFSRSSRRSRSASTKAN